MDWVAVFTHWIAAFFGGVIGFFVAGLFKVGKGSDLPPPPPSPREAGRRYCGND